MSKKICDRCDGCGRVATDENGTPWSHLVGSSDQEFYHIGDVTLWAVTCGKCCGTGTPKQDQQDIIV